MGRVLHFLKQTVFYIFWVLLLNTLLVTIFLFHSTKSSGASPANYPGTLLGVPNHRLRTHVLVNTVESCLKPAMCIPLQSVVRSEWTAMQKLCPDPSQPSFSVSSSISGLLLWLQEDKSSIKLPLKSHFNVSHLITHLTPLFLLLFWNSLCLYASFHIPIFVFLRLHWPSPMSPVGQI